MNSQMNMINRSTFLDIAKGYAILLVVVGHAIQMMSRTTFKNNPLFNFIYVFHMPLFIFLSGISFSFYKDKKFKDVLISRIITLLLPFFAWHILAGILTNRIPFNFIDAIKYVYGVIYNPEIGLWFLWVIFFDIIFTLFIYKILNLSKLGKTNHQKNLLFYGVLIILGILGVFMSTPRAFGIELLAKRYIFFVLGILAYQYKDFFRKFINFKALVYIMPLILFFIYNSLFRITGGILLSQIMPCLQDLVFYLISISLIFAVLVFIKDIKLPTRIENFFIYCGLNSLGIYAIHWSIIFSLGQGFYNQGDLNVFTLIISSLALLLVSIALIELLFKRDSLLNLLFLGQKNKFQLSISFFENKTNRFSILRNIK